LYTSISVHVPAAFQLNQRCESPVMPCTTFTRFAEVVLHETDVPAAFLAWQNVVTEAVSAFV
jgi:hypothetical protein